MKKSAQLIVAALSLVALTAGATLLWRFSPMADSVTTGGMLHTLRSIRDQPSAPYLFVAAFPVAGLIVFPVMLLSGIVAMLFTPLKAMAISFTGIMLSAALLHKLGSLFQGTVSSALGSSVKRVKSLLRKQGVITIAALRMVPLAPFTIVNLTIGALGIGFRDYMLGTALGLAPGMIMVSLFGHQARQIWRHPTPARIAAGIAFLLGWLLLSMTLQRYARHHHSNPE